MLFHYFFTLYLSLVYTVNYFHLFPVITQHATYKSRTNAKLSLYLKKAGLASRNIVHLKKRSFYVVSTYYDPFIIMYMYGASYGPNMNALPKAGVFPAAESRQGFKIVALAMWEANLSPLGCSEH